MPLLASDICVQAAARMNDQSQTDYTNTVLLPFVKDAFKELQLELHLNGSLALEKINAVVTLPALSTSFSTAAILPSDLLEPQRLWERHVGETYWHEMNETTWPPDVIQTTYNTYWSEAQQDIIVPGATVATEVKIFGIKSLSDITSASDPLPINECQPFMVNRVAALASRFIGNNPTRANALDAMAVISLSKLTQIGGKSKQGVRFRRRPFRLKNRYWV
jgi:hypothetical protein